jgi:uncharacterized protein (TIGR02246 family)
MLILLTRTSLGRVRDDASAKTGSWVRSKIQGGTSVSKHRGDIDSERAIRTVIENWAAAVRRKDVDAILSHHAADIVMFDVPPPLQSTGIDAYKKTWDLFFSWSHDPVVFDIMEMQVTAGENVAFATALMRCSGTEKNGTDLALDFRLTVGLQKIDGQWVITHEHHSIPAED